jgi:hypothetical protein
MTEYEKAATELCEYGFRARLVQSFDTEELWLIVRVPGVEAHEEFKLDYETVSEWAERYEDNNAGIFDNDDLIDIEKDND